VILVSTPLLTTKLYIPPPRSNLVPRPRLIERLDAGLDRKLTLISAPAGFGKTTLLSNWVRRLDHPVAWVSLDKGDNDLTSFLVYFVAALQTIETGISETVLHAPQPPPIESVLTELINEVASIEQNFILVLDDYHVIEAQAVHNALTFLLDHLPPKMHLVITSRSDPLLQIPRLRAQGQITELRAENLRFTTQEATSFLNQVMGLALSEDDVLSLETRTEGWITGLHLAALSLQEKEDAAGFISAFTGDDRYIVDYLVDEVLAQRPKGTQDFLLQTSILDRMAGPLCDAVTGQEGGQDLLERLDQANLFIVPLDNRRRWYRYHRLFADLLRQRLAEGTNSQEINILHQRASQWYEENDFLIEAVEHALAAEDFDNVIRLIDLGAGELLMRSQQSLLLKWQDQLPRELVASHPRFCMIIAWAWVSMGHPQEAENCLQIIEGSLGTEMAEIFSERDRAKEIDPAVQSALVEIAVLRIELAIEQGNISRVFELARLVLPYLEDEKRLPLFNQQQDLRTVVFFVLGLAYKISGKLGEANEALSEAAVLGQERGNVHIVAGSVGHLASVQSMQGHLHQAVSTCQRGLKLVQEMVGERSPMSGLIHAELGNLLYEQNDLETALHHLQEGIDVAKPWGLLEAFIHGYTGLARVRAAQGNWDGAFAALDELAELGQANPAMVMPAVETLRALLWVALGKVDAAYHWVMNAGLDPQGEINYHRLGELMVLARVLIARGANIEVVDLLTRMMDTAESAGWFGRLIEMRILLALAHQAGGEREKSMVALEQALISAKPEGYVRVFVDEGHPIATLLSGAETRGIAPDYVPKLLAAFETDNVQVEPPSVTALIEPLSQRELEVLRLLKTELSGPEIADQLMIALSTMRTHTQNIYSKLGVSNRLAAVRRAEELNLR
jgi:LuxR family maltose regulon positive regulatory protein